MKAISMMGVLLVAIAGCVLDTDRDGVREIMFVGDSNTHLLPCAYPLAWQARHDPVKVRGYDEGVFGDRAEHWFEDGLLFDAIARDRPDAVVIALGTNDLGTGATPEDTLTWLWMLYQQAEVEGVQAYVATVPPIYDPDDLNPDKEALMMVEVPVLNELIRTTFAPERVVDFDSWMPTSWTADYYCVWALKDGSGVSHDGTHVSCAAHAIRADVIDVMLNGRLSGTFARQ